MADPISIPAPPRPLTLELTSDPAELAPARHAVEAFSIRAGLTPMAAADLGLSVNEALANVMRHAYGGERGRPIHLRVDCDPRAVRVTIRDWGNGINPQQRPPADHDPQMPGGIGMICLRKLTDGIAFAPQPDGMLLTMEKKMRGNARETLKDER